MGYRQIINATTNLDGSFHVTGTLFNGISEGAGYGDDWQMNSDYPIARMTNAAGNTLYARTYGWSTCSLMTGTNVVTTEMALPAGMLAGTYPLGDHYGQRLCFRAVFIDDFGHAAAGGGGQPDVHRYCFQ